MAIAVVCQPIAASAAGPDLPGVDQKDLDADEKKLLVSVLTEQFDPCGKPRSFLESLQDKSTCAVAPKLGNFVVGQIQRGLSKRQIVRALLKEQKRLTVRHKFTTDGRPFSGDADGKVLIVEFFDFQCPHCKIASNELGKLIKGKKGVKLVYKQYPLEFHPAAKVAAIAALAASRQGKYHVLQRAFFADQDKLDEALVAKIVREAGLDMKRFAEDQKWAAEAVAADMKEGDVAGVDGTPTFYVNGRMVPYEELGKAIDDAVAGK